MRSSTGSPMLPPRITRSPPARKTSVVSAVVVVLPLVPVIPAMWEGQARKKRSISLVTSMPRRRAVSTRGSSQATPGLTTRRSRPVRSSGP